MATVRILAFHGDPSGNQGFGYFNRGQLELDAIPPIGATVQFVSEGGFEELIVHEVQLVVGPGLMSHYALLTAGKGMPYRHASGVVSPPIDPNQRSFTVHPR
jgi:hypothetical protein